MMWSILEVFSNRTEKSIHVWIKVHYCNYLITHLYLVTNQNQNKMTTTSTRTSQTTDKH